MLSVGMDIGTSTVKLVLLRDGAMAKQCITATLLSA